MRRPLGRGVALCDQIDHGQSDVFIAAAAEIAEAGGADG
jgi:hypothetical protein